MIFTSPDNAETTSDWIRAFGQDNVGFYTGSAEYFYTLNGNTLQISVRNDYTIASGVTRNNMDNLHRVPGQQSPLGNTTQFYNFSIDLNEVVNSGR